MSTYEYIPPPAPTAASPADRSAEGGPSPALTIDPGPVAVACDLVSVGPSAPAPVDSARGFGFDLSAHLYGRKP